VFPKRFFAPTYFPARYFPEVGGSTPPPPPAPSGSLSPLRIPYYASILDKSAGGQISKEWFNYFQSLANQIQAGAVNTVSGTAPISVTPGTTPVVSLNLSGVTNAHLAHAPALTLKGNATGGSTNPQDLSVADVLAMLGLSSAVTGAGTPNNVTLFSGPHAVGDAPGFSYNDSDGNAYFISGARLEVSGIVDSSAGFVTDGNISMGGTAVIGSLAGSGNRLVTASTVGLLSNATTIDGNYVFAGTLAVGGTLTVASDIKAQTTIDIQRADDAYMISLFYTNRHNTNAMSNLSGGADNSKGDNLAVGNPGGGALSLFTSDIERVYIDPTGFFEAQKTLRTIGSIAPSSGAGVEIDYGAIADTGRIFAYDRTASAYKAIRIGQYLDIAASGDMNVNGGKFTVAAANGNTAIAGTLSVGDDLSVAGDDLIGKHASGLDIHTDGDAKQLRFGGGSSASDGAGAVVAMYGNSSVGRNGFLYLSAGAVATASIQMLVRDDEQNALQVLDHSGSYEIMGFDTRTGARVIRMGDAVTMAGPLTISNLSSGRVPVISASGLVIQDDLYWDATHKRLGIGAAAGMPQNDLHIARFAPGATVSALVYNPDDSADSHAKMDISVGTASGTAGNAWSHFSNASFDWSAGLVGTSGLFCIGASSVAGNYPALTIDYTTLLTIIKAGLVVEGTRFSLPNVAGDPASPNNGDMWYDTVSGHIRGKSAANGVGSIW
jgi:hypothetical protein